jgi:hypothetical protein
MIPSKEIYYIEQLKEKLEGKIGFKILRFYDCRIFSELLEKEKIIVSPHTLARFYGLLKRGHKPYVSTMNMLAEFLGHESFAVFSAKIDALNVQLLSSPNCFLTGEFSFIALELAIHNCDYKNVQLILEEYDYKNSLEKNEVTAFLGKAVRNHAKKDGLLKALVEIENGRDLFYESFVDEDDLGNYYSDALSNHYIKHKKDEKSLLFKSCFQNAKKIYQNKLCDKFELDFIQNFSFDLTQLHFHQLSRLFELKILISGQQNKPLSHTSGIVQEMLSVISYYTIDEQKWFISRVIKALAFTNRFTFALHNSEFKEKITQYYFQTVGKVTDVAELINQLTSHIIIDKPNKLHPLQKIKGNPINETNTRIAVESATAYLYAKQPIKSIIDKNLRNFAQQTGNSWIMNLLEMKGC